VIVGNAAAAGDGAINQGQRLGAMSGLVRDDPEQMQEIGVIRRLLQQQAVERFGPVEGAAAMILERFVK
jgi:hypothetical protein